MTTEGYRRTGLEQYRNYENIPLSVVAVDKEYELKSKDGNYYEFFRNTRAAKPPILHFLHTSLSPDSKLIAIVGDHLDGLLVDSTTGKTVATMEGHRDYSFASAWHPDGTILATGNQDKTCRVWDVRNLSSPVSVLKGNIGAVRSVCFSSDGQFLVVAEDADFVHVYNTNLNYETRQEIDFFAEIAGVSVSPDDESLYIGVWDRTYGSLLQYNKV
ncbi:putative WD repeat-containing protein C2A9.03 [Bidens hawaiensis]|uniref:putative WD repeat-containing protein C2A9.03 n=1 Tax=Bidens hawaiensis TaxID=980011 RepID=UPI00404A7246